ncbi:HepT-like ribonuclease domain-containing protein [Sulfurovum sp.]|uniref:HepT-like ribonuclease domain-containing protein n=1 Tax=Sulfurovum sp. TaxID=1969726 RepID=UPI0025FC6FDF|nr:HepT-like ribonuclease domain-containing protein [Sulfurovum sp.]
MSNSAIEAQIAYIQKKISYIETILKRHNGTKNALADEVEARAAIMMSLMQIGETINKIDAGLLEQFDLLRDAKGAYSVRNFIAHDYEGVDVALIAEIINDNVPQLGRKLQNLKEYISSNG